MMGLLDEIGEAPPVQQGDDDLGSAARRTEIQKSLSKAPRTEREQPAVLTPDRWREIQRSMRVEGEAGATYIKGIREVDFESITLTIEQFFGAR